MASCRWSSICVPCHCWVGGIMGGCGGSDKRPLGVTCCMSGTDSAMALPMFWKVAIERADSVCNCCCCCVWMLM
eukprot:3416867-Alexandrium_andersonii.AAC.1